MRVAIVINTAWNIYNFRSGLVRKLMDNGADLIAIAPPDGYEKKLIEMGCEFIPVPMEKTGANPLREIQIVYRLYRAYKKSKPDIVLHFTIKPNTYGSMAAKWLGIPSINNVSGLGTVFLNDGLVSRIALSVYRMTFKYPVKVFFQNLHDRKLFLEKKLVSEELTEVIPGSGINLEKFSPSEKPAHTDFTFLMISRLLIDKGILEFIEAIGMLNAMGVKAKYQILGPMDPQHKRGVAEEKVKNWTEKGLVEYLGTTDDVRQYISKVHCVILPSYREGTPKTLLEAAAMGKPLIATDVPGCNNVVKHEYNGYLCRVKDARDLAEKMKEMVYIDPETRAQFGRNSRHKVEQEFDENIVINKYLETINQNLK